MEKLPLRLTVMKRMARNLDTSIPSNILLLDKLEGIIDLIFTIVTMVFFSTDVEGKTTLLSSGNEFSIEATVIEGVLTSRVKEDIALVDNVKGCSLMDVMEAVYHRCAN